MSAKRLEARVERGDFELVAEGKIVGMRVRCTDVPMSAEDMPLYIYTSDDLLQAATAFVEELKSFGYGQTSEKALPGSYDALVAALERIKE